ncbi:MAG: GIY-YIG nuclease family protein [Vibrio splendidus]
MLTLFEKPTCSKELFFSLSNSLQIVTPEYKSPTHKYAGIYVIYKGDNCYYVGQSQNLASRISQHLSGKYKECDRVEIFYAHANGLDEFYRAEKGERKSILEHNEMEFIKRLSPIENLITTPSDFNLDDSIAFNCLADEEENYPSCFIFIGKSELAVTIKGCMTFVEYDLTAKHNLEVAKAVNALGYEKAMEVISNG